MKLKWQKIPKIKKMDINWKKLQKEKMLQNLAIEKIKK